MKEKRVTKRAILASLLSVAVCTSMLIGTSYAWFTDSAVSSGNVIKSGTLDVGFEWAQGKDVTVINDTVNWKDVDAPNADPIFNCELWEPGHMEVRHVRVKNNGTLALKYQFYIQPTGTLATNNDGKTLADAINVYYYDPAYPIPSRDAFTTQVINDAETTGKLSDLMANIGQTASGHLLPNESVNVTIVLEMDKNAGNAYQNMELGSGFDLKLLATQWTYEEDTFDNQYDKDADETPDKVGFTAMKASATVTDATADTVINGVDGTKMIVPAGAAAQNAEVTYTVTPLTSGNAGFYVAEGQQSESFEIDTSTTIDDTAVKVFIKKAAPGLDSSTVHVLHNGTAMTQLTGKQDNLATASEGYWYDATTGEVYIYTKTFSPFAVVVDMAGTKSVSSIAELNAALADSTTSTIVLMDDITATAPVAITKDITIDGAGHSINANGTGNNGRGIWVDESNVNVTLKNLKIVPGSGCQRGFQVNGNKTGVTALIDNCEIKASMYAINLCTGTQVNITIKNSTVSAWGAVNAWSNGDVVNIENCVLEGINDKGYNAEGWNDFATLVMEGDTTGLTTEHSSGLKFTVKNSTIKVSQTTGNVQTVIGFNEQSVGCSIELTNCKFDIGNGCKFGYDNGTNSVIMIDGKYFKKPSTGDYFDVSDLEEQTVITGGGQDAQGGIPNPPPLPIPIP